MLLRRTIPSALVVIGALIFALSSHPEPERPKRSVPVTVYIPLSVMLDVGDFRVPTTTTSSPDASPPPASQRASSSPRVWGDDELIRVARCEQPGAGEYGVRWDHPGPIYEGGPGFAASTYDAVRDPDWPDNAGNATVAQQLEAMRRVLARWPDAWWSCRTRDGIG